MAADVLARAGLEVTIFDRMGSVGRKFLLAGRGGLNITHSEELPRFLARYAEGNPRLRSPAMPAVDDTSFRERGKSRIVVVNKDDLHRWNGGLEFTINAR
jgi:predicted flavoprotein YhiN